MPSVVDFVDMLSVAEVVDVLLVGKSSEVLPVPSPTRLESDEAELQSTSPQTTYPPASVISVIVVQPFDSIVFPSPAAVLVGRLSAMRRRVPHPGFALVGFLDGRRDLGGRGGI